MSVYIVRRALLILPVVIVVMTITFALVSALPVSTRLTATFGQPNTHNVCGYDPTCTSNCPNGEPSCPNPVYDRDVATLGLNQPIPLQWAKFMFNELTFNWGRINLFGGVVEGDSGNSLGTLAAMNGGEPVTTVIGWALPYTVELGLMSLALILAIALPLGTLTAVYRNRPVDQAARVLSFSGYALPGFLLGSLAVIAFLLITPLFTGYIIHTPWCPGGEPPLNEIYGSWPSAASSGAGGFSTCYGAAGPTSNGGYPTWLTFGVISHPTGFPTIDAAANGYGWLAVDSLVRLILPALVITFGAVAVLLRFVRNSMLEVLNLDFVRTARAKGVPEKEVVNRHAGRNSLNVTITVLGLTFAGFVGGFPIIEKIFGLNGIGLLLALSVGNASVPPDFSMLFGATLLFTYIVVIANIIVDVLYAYLDPRVRLG